MRNPYTHKFNSGLQSASGRVDAAKVCPRDGDSILAEVTVCACPSRLTTKICSLSFTCILREFKGVASFKTVTLRRRNAPKERLRNAGPLDKLPQKLEAIPATEQCPAEKVDRYQPTAAMNRIQQVIRR